MGGGGDASLVPTSQESLFAGLWKPGWEDADADADADADGDADADADVLPQIAV